MKNKIFIFLISIFSFFLFQNSVHALTEYKLVDYSDDPVTCIYEQQSNLNVTLRLVYENNKFSVFSNEMLMSNVDFSPSVVIKRGRDCPEDLTLSTSGSLSEDYTILVEFGSIKVSCGNVTGIPKKIPELTSLAFTIIQVAIPVILILLGSIDLFKGITAGKEDEIKKGQQMFIKRLAVAAIIFFVVIIVKFFISILGDANQDNIIDCIDCFIDNDC